MKQEDIDEMYMRRCLQLARNGRLQAKPNPMVGAVIVSGEGKIIGEGYHVRCGEGHAEVNAFRSVRSEDEHLLSEATIYVSLEPCSHHGKTPPCADLIIRKGVRRVVCGCVDPFSAVQGRGIERIRKAGIDVTVGVLEQECLMLNREFIARNTFFGVETIVAHQDGLPTLNARDGVAKAFTRSNVRRDDVLRHQWAHTIVHQNEVVVVASLGLQSIDAVVNRLHPRLATFENPPQFGNRKLVGIRAQHRFPTFQTHHCNGFNVGMAFKSLHGVHNNRTIVHMDKLFGNLLSHAVPAAAGNQ